MLTPEEFKAESKASTREELHSHFEQQAAEYFGDQPHYFMIAQATLDENTYSGWAMFTTEAHHSTR